MGKTVDTLIIGQGLAGTLLSYELLSRGQNVLVIDDGDPASASRLAAGLMSPITGQRGALHWRAPELMAAALSAYAAIESLLQARFYFPLPLERRYLDEADRARFLARKSDPAYAPWLGEESPDLGGIAILGAGRLDCHGLLMVWRKHLRALACLNETPFDFNDLQLSPGGATWKGIQAKRVVLARGVKESPSGPFAFLRFQPTKGELIEVSASADAGLIRQSSSFALPISPGRFKVGATYDREDLFPTPTPAARAFLSAAAQSHLGPCQILNHQAGIRPNLLGHFPVIGTHPSLPSLAIINGFGSKGSLWAPYAASMLAEWMMEGKGIAAELDVSRFSPCS